MQQHQYVGQIKVADFDPVDYQKLLEEFAKCRRGVEVQTLFEHLSNLTPGSYMNKDTKELLDRRCASNQKASWYKCVIPAQNIRKFLLNE
jgi:hypothetical protein